MKHLKIYFIFLFFTFFVSGQTKISGIQAKLFYNEKNDNFEHDDFSGTFSDNVIDNNEIGLNNVIIGEGGGIGGTTRQTIVIIEITSIKQTTTTNNILKFTATAGKRVLLQNTQTFDFLSDDAIKKYKLLFLLNDTGCEKIYLKAEILKNNKSISTMIKTIDFECAD
jgi:hypothetical protein